jgi:hypothetical protein
MEVESEETLAISIKRVKGANAAAFGTSLDQNDSIYNSKDCLEHDTV